MRKISTVFDFIIYNLFLFIVLLIAFSSFTNGYFPLALSLISLIGFSALFLKIRGDVFKKKNTANATKKKQKLVETSLLYQTNSECLAFFANFFKSYQGLDLKQNGNFLESTETIVYPCFSSKEASFEELLKISKIAREKSAKHLIIPCIKRGDSGEFLSTMFQTVSIFESEALFDKMVEFDFFPTMIDQKVLEKKSYKALFSAFVTKKKARGFGLIGISLFALAFISPFKVYYMIASAILLLLSALLLLKGK